MFKLNRGKRVTAQTSKFTKSLMFTTIILFTFAFLSPSNNIFTAKPAEIWEAHPLYISPYSGASTPIGYSPSQIRAAYNLPNYGGNGTTIAIIGAFHVPNIEEYFNTFSNEFGLPDNSTGNFIVKSMGTSEDPNWALETCLDVEWAHAIAPNATILLVEAADNRSSSLIDAVDYATSQPGVVAVSMSWGGKEVYDCTYFDSHFNKIGITFFAASGDDGANVNWPAVSSYVVSVGGTTLSLDNCTVISETAWQKSSGGISEYVSRPYYQSKYGLNYSGRAVPDVAYDANPSTGVAVYDGTWHKVGGTSAGAPQWAAICALGQSANNYNVYARAKVSYNAYFRDITEGVNSINNATNDYDLVTGLGSPLTIYYGTQVNVYPTEGAPNTQLTINGSAFRGYSVDISYLDPFNYTWIKVADDVPLTSQNFTYTMTAPDFMRANPKGDNPQIYDKVIFRATDNYGRSYNSTTAFTEYRRGLTQVGNAVAQGIIGNNSNLAASAFVQNGGDLQIVGKWFRPGTAAILWDNIEITTATINEKGQFSVNIPVPQTTLGKHTIGINDNSTTFFVNLTCVPSIAIDYTDVWHTSDFSISITADSPVNDIFYRINGGSTHSVSVDGQPQITAEGADNMLETWISWNSPDTGPIEVHYGAINGIKLDKTAPSGSVTTTSSVTQSSTITLSFYAYDATSGVTGMRLKNENGDWSGWMPYTSTKSWTLSSGYGVKTVYVQYMDNAGLTSPTYSCAVTVQTPIEPSSNPFVSEPTATPTVSPTPPVSEFSVWMVLFLLAASSLLILALVSKKRSRQTKEKI